MNPGFRRKDGAGWVPAGGGKGGGDRFLDSIPGPASARVGVDPNMARVSSDCGSIQGVTIEALTAIYNVLVRGDIRSASVRVTVSWFNPNAPFECVTTGVWESDTQQSIRRRAEGGG